MKQLIFSLILCVFTLNIQAQDTTSTDNFQKTDEVLSTIIEKALLVAEQTGEFVIEQAPLVLQEFYMWNISSSIFWMIFGLLIMFLGYRIPYLFGVKEKTNQYYQKYFNRYFYDSGAAWISFVIGMIVGSISLILNLYYLIYILVAPKLYLIDYFIK